MGRSNVDTCLAGGEPAWLAGDRLEALVRALTRVRVAVLGDFCLDVYWFLEAADGERSLETGLPVLKAGELRCSPGGAANVAANLKALGCRDVLAFGVVGDDLFGRELTQQLGRMGIETGGLQMQGEGWITTAYCKPHGGGDEQERIDFGRRNVLSPAAADALLGAVEEALPDIDALIINEQVGQSLWTPGFTASVSELCARRPGPFVCADVRHLGAVFPGAAVQFSAGAAAAAAGASRGSEGTVPLERVREWAEAVHSRTQQPVLITCGARGNLLRTASGCYVQPGVPVGGDCDPVGAGDASVAAFAAAVAAGAELPDAAALANLAAAVTVQKLRVTGVATPAELLALGGRVAQDDRARPAGSRAVRGAGVPGS